ncbi:hypothetical protein Syn7502_00171 [Synechococcus sp. PCC 7502]|uniref:4-fold beta flower protein n=1 Tax=Synechococcus sp. PCC 7502 TaxID=1173263 RepID=UPI00029F85BD|nr:hypothetical protein [Synechococcus sp. PCC 7502]AFY72339.1 hypothetical protein Syn7502_00171 [Synechococcus sp. PCC 7502]
MEPIFDRNGRTLGWLRDEVILDTNNRNRAFIRDESVYTYQGQYLGRFNKGFFRDRHGNSVAFIQGASGGPITPIPEIPPIPPIPPISPIPPIPQIPPIPPISSLGWSTLSWEQFLVP